MREMGENHPSHSPLSLIGALNQIKTETCDQALWWYPIPKYNRRGQTTQRMIERGASPEKGPHGDEARAALLMCSNEWCRWHFRKKHIEFLNQCWSERTVLHG